MLGLDKRLQKITRARGMNGSTKIQGPC